MKKGKLLMYMALALLLVPAVAFSQSTITVEQYGSGNTATPTQTGGDLLEAFIYQGSTTTLAIDNQAVQNQTDGTGNIATIEQARLADGSDNYAEQNQFGIDSIGNNARITQVGDNSAAYQTQYGNTNTAWIEQDGTGALNVAYQFQGETDPLSGGNFAYIRQIGEDNSATQRQDGLDNNSLLGLGTPGILQDGSNNVANQEQNGNSNETLISQTGNDNQATQVQIGSSNNLTALQFGIIQVGDGNKATQEQFGDDNSAFISQNGNLNEATQTQTGNGHTANVTQNGNSNFCLQVQGGTAPRVSTLTQNGDFLSATIIQN